MLLCKATYTNKKTQITLTYTPTLLLKEINQTSRIESLVFHSGNAFAHLTVFE